ncbi:MAG: sigma-54-dependent Fis family transcriptional regulator [bacterium]|nr:sigma-54-dependent Fis family transcriptional regulator [bacterium]
MKHNFDRYEYTTSYALNSIDALSCFMNQPVDAVILDLRLGRENGLDLLQQLVALNPDVPIIILTGFATIQTAIESIKLGAYDYVQKPMSFQKLHNVIEHAIKFSALKQENDGIKSKLIDATSKIITQNHRMMELCVKAKKLANSIIGVFERADKSTLFLDEIVDMPLSTQAKILRAIQNQEIRRVGGKDFIKIDTRLVGATNKNLQALIQENTFREDLYYRLNATILCVPPLRERKEDILVLTEHFLQDFARSNDTDVKLLSDAVIDVFHHYDWPGNVRELKNTLNYAMTITMNEPIDLEDLPGTFLRKKSETGDTEVIDVVEKNLIFSTLKKTDHNKKKDGENAEYQQEDTL